MHLHSGRSRNGALSLTQEQRPQEYSGRPSIVRCAPSSMTWPTLGCAVRCADTPALTLTPMSSLRGRMLGLFLLSGSVATASSLAPAVPGPAPAAPSADPLSWYRTAREPVYRIDSGRSLIAVTVRRGGPLSRLGHDHVVASRNVEGYAAPSAGRADFQFRLDELTVDEPELRKVAQLDTVPSAAAIAGTRANMRRVLEAERYPMVQLHAERMAGDKERLQLAVSLHGVTRSYEVPTRIETSPGELTASGELRLLQTDFGIKPMSVMGGAIAVEDPIDVRFEIVATEK